ncbi:MAG: type II toxin-antitoxin system HicA family toxin [Turicibacter sp.]|nr:type II toxin-antitoxin system HicA family toxin [Turicibacter sp.]
MSRKQKLIDRLKSKPRDMTFDEIETLLSLLGFRRSNQGKTSGSRVKFSSDKISDSITLHKPHPSNIMKPPYLNYIENILEKEELI